jgi:DNA-binding NtrC family response regulator
MEQLQGIIGDMVELQGYACTEGITGPIEADLMVVSSAELLTNETMRRVPANLPCLVAKRSINHTNLEPLMSLPADTEVLLVNDTERSAADCIASLRRLGLDHLRYVPFSPQDSEAPDVAIAVTPGEPGMVPASVTRVIDIGPRLIDMTTVAEIIRFLDLTGDDLCLSERYMKRVVQLGRSLAQRHGMEELGRGAEFAAQVIIGNSHEIKRIRELCGRLGQSDLNALIEGESGTGKELIAATIHGLSRRRSGPFVTVAVSDLPEEFIERELFGSGASGQSGAETGGRPGLFEQANGGTIFLDEVGDIPLRVQTHLLRALREKQVRRVGGDRPIPLDVRVIAAATRSLDQLVDRGEFRQDLYHWLKVLYLRLPPLREHKSDITELLHHFCRIAGHADMAIDPVVLSRLQQYDWWGNIRELKNTVDYMLAVCDGRRLTEADLPDQHFFQHGQTRTDLARVALPQFGAASQAERLMAEWTARGELETFRMMLSVIASGTRAQRVIGRQAIAAASRELLSAPLTEQQVRHRLDLLADSGLVNRQRGRYGTKLTPLGDAVVQAMNAR